MILKKTKKKKPQTEKKDDGVNEANIRSHMKIKPWERYMCINKRQY